MPSKIVRYLTETEITNLTKEVLLVDYKLWNSHCLNDIYLVHGALREGKTIYIKDQNYNISAGWDCFPTAMSIASSFSNFDNIGKFYLHRLLPEEKIHLHNDSLIFKKEKIKKRIQIYLDISKSVKIIIDKKLIDNDTLKNSILEFDATMLHSYRANNDSLYFFVFDILDR